MSYTFTIEEQERLSVARALCPVNTSNPELPTSLGNWKPLYTELSLIAAERISDGTVMGDDLQDLKNMKLWLDVAIGANSGEGIHSIFIRAFTNRQAELRRGNEFSEEEMQFSSNGVAFNLWRDLADPEGVRLESERWRVPSIDELANLDASSIGVNLYGGNASNPLPDANDTAITANAGWSGTLGFNFLGGRDPYESWRLLISGEADGVTIESTLNTLDDFKNILFAVDAYQHALAISPEAILSGLNAAIDIFALGGGYTGEIENLQALVAQFNIFWANGEASLYVKAAAEKTPAISPLVNLISDMGTHQFLDMLRGAITGESFLGDTTEDNFADNAHDFFTAYNATELQDLQATLLPTNAEELEELALTDVNVRVALASLSVVAVEVSVDVAESFDLYNSESGQGEVTKQWIHDRALMLQWFIKHNVSGTEYGEEYLNPDAFEDTLGFVGNFSYTDLGTIIDGEPLKLNVDGEGLATPYNQIKFGTNTDDIIEGLDPYIGISGGGLDRLYGGDGDDTLKGNGGSDYLEGGKGNDSYFFGYGDGNDTIVDGVGNNVLHIQHTKNEVGHSTLNNISLKKISDSLNVYVQFDPATNERINNTRYVVDGKDLIIQVDGGAGGRITLRDFDLSENAFGLTFEGVEQVEYENTLSNGPNIIGNGLTGVGDELVDRILPNHDINTTSIVYDASVYLGNSPDETYNSGAVNGTLANGYVFGGSAVDDELIGTTHSVYEDIPLRDSLFGYGGDDIIRGEAVDATTGDDDFLVGGKGNDSVTGGFGDDYLFGTANNLEAAPGTLNVSNLEESGDTDYLDGGAGRDVLIAGSGSDTLLGGDGNDLIFGFAGGDFIFGGEGSDTVHADGYAQSFEVDVDPGAGSRTISVTTYTGFDFSLYDNYDDVIDTGGGDDSIYGSAGSDIIDGGEGNDFIFGDQINSANANRQDANGVKESLESAMRHYTELHVTLHGADLIYGGAGDDDIYGNAGNDSLHGNEGNDYIDGDDFILDVSHHGDDYITGGAGEDTLLGSGGNDIILGEADDDIIFGDRGIDLTFNGVEYFGDVVGGSDELYGGDGNDSIYAGGGDDYIDGGSGADFIRGGEGVDTIIGGDGDDDIKGQEGNDYAEGGDGVDLISGQTGNDVLHGNLGNDALWGDEGDDKLYGGDGDDQLLGGSGSDIIYGDDGVDLILGDAGDDSLYGGDGNDEIQGGSGNDTIVSGKGNDVLYGQTGDDNYTFVVGDGNDQLVDDSIGLLSLESVSSIDIIGDFARINYGSSDTVLTYLDNFKSAKQIEIDGEVQEAVIVTESGGLEWAYGNNSDNTVLQSALGGVGGVKLFDGDDYLIADSGAAMDVYGGDGDDTLSAATGSGGYLQGGQGNDTYLFKATGGSVEIDNSGSVGDSDVLKVLEGIEPSSISVTRDETDVLLTVGSTGSVIRLSNFYSTIDGDVIENQISVEFDNGTVWDMAKLNNFIYPRAFNTDPELIDPLLDQTVNEDESILFTIPLGAFEDADGDALSYTAALSSGDALPTWLTFDSSTLTFSGTPENGDVSAVDVIVFADDGYGGVVSDAFTLTVVNTNDTPVAQDDAASTNQDSAIVFTIAELLANDSDVDAGDLLSLIGVSNSVNGIATLDAVAGIITFTPNTGYLGEAQFDYTIVDSSGAEDVATVTVAVSEVSTNTAPVVDTPVEAQSTDEDSLFSFTVPVGTFSDVDGDVLTYAVSLASGDALPSWLSFDAATQTFSGIPLNDDVGALDLQITASDPSGESVSAEFTLSINNTNDAPVAENDTANTVEDSSIVLTVADLLTNDSDIDSGDSLSITEVSNAVNGMVSFDEMSGQVTFTPTADFVGEASFDYTVSDGNGGTQTASVSIEVDAVNDAPVLLGAIADQVTDEDAVFTLAIPPGVFSDIDGDALTYSASLVGDSALPSWLTFDAATQTFSGTPTNAEVGNLDIQVTASDPSGEQVSSTFALAINNTNDAPVAVNDISVTDEDSAVVINVGELLANDFDIDVGDLLSITGVSNSVNGSAILDAVAGTITFTPNVGYFGAASFDYTVSDGLDSTTASVEITVNEVEEIVTVDGDNGSNTLQGSSIDDVIDGHDGSDQLFGYDGDDKLYGGNDNDYLFGGNGNDTANGDAGDDMLFGGLGDDILNGGDGVDTLFGEGGDDTLNGGAGNDQIYAADGNDVLDGGSGNDQLYGEAGHDTILGGSGNDEIHGSEGNDSIGGNEGADVIYGGNGDDTLNGGSGVDHLFGEVGNDTYVFDSGFGQDTVHNNDWDPSSFDRAKFESVDVEDLWFHREGSNLLISVVGTDDVATVEDWYNGSSQQLDQIEVGSSVLLGNQIDQLVNAMASYSPPVGVGSIVPQYVKDSLEPVLLSTWSQA